MNTKIVTASGSTKGAMRIPMALSTWSRIWIGDRFEEQLHSAGHARRGDLGAQEERHRDDDHGGDRGRIDRVGVDGHAEPGGRVVLADLDSRRGQDGLSHPLGSLLPPRVGCQRDPGAQLLPDRQRGRHTSSTWNSASPNTTPKPPAGRKTNAMINPMTVIIGQPCRRIERHRALHRMFFGGDRCHRTLHQNGIEQTQ